MAELLNVSQADDVKYHDRLDLKLHVDDYSDQPCGSLSPKTGKPMYCSHECPTLRDSIVKSSER